MKNDDKSSKTVTKKGNLQEKSINKRRKFLAGVTASAAAAGVASGGKWVKPVVDSVVLPVHAQTSGSNQMKLQSRITEASSFQSSIRDVTYTDGTYTFNDGGDFDDFSTSYSALFQPIQDEAVSVNLDVNIDLTGPGDLNFDDSLSQTSSANLPVDGAMRANFTIISDVDLDGTTDASVATIVGTIRADGYATRRVTYIING